MSRLFSSARAIVSCNERYRLPARSRASSRGVSARLSLGCGTGRYGLVILPTMPVFIVVAGSSGGAAAPPPPPPPRRGGGGAHAPPGLSRRGLWRVCRKTRRRCQQHRAEHRNIRSDTTHGYGLPANLEQLWSVAFNFNGIVGLCDAASRIRS